MTHARLWVALLLSNIWIAVRCSGTPAPHGRHLKDVGQWFSQHRNQTDSHGNPLHSVNGSAVWYGSNATRTHLTRSDLLVAIPSSSDRLPLIHGSRAWREGVPTYVITETGSNATNLIKQAHSEGAKLEQYGEWQDARWCMKPGDVRAGVTPFLAAKLSSYKFKWLLYGDDDTVFFVENALSMLEGLDHDMPYFLTDHLWYPDLYDKRGGNDHRKMHPNRSAPRCLPCGYQDPLHKPNGTSSHVPEHSFRAPEGCPCTLEAVCKGADNPGYWGKECEWQHDAHPGWWYFEHGGAGAILSVGLLKSIPWADVSKAFDTDQGVSGDSQFMSAVYRSGGILPTDPGYGYYRPKVYSFDPGWKGEQAKGPEDQGIADLGNDPLGIIERLQAKLAGKPCNSDCEEALQHMLTTHIRSRYTASEHLRTDDLPSFTYTGPAEHHATVYVQHKLAFLYDQYVAEQQSSQH